MNKIDKWIVLVNKIGFELARIVAMGVSYLGRTDTWRFLAWYNGLKGDKKLVMDEYFNEYLLLELREMSENQHSDISHLVSYFNLPEPIRIYPKFLPREEFIKTKEAKDFYYPRVYKRLRLKYIGDD